MPKRGPNVLVTGTPGCGKSSLCESLVSRVPGYRHVIVGELVREKGLHAGAGTHGALQIDEASEDRIVDELEGVLAEGCTLLEHHSVDFFPERWFDLVLVLRTDNTLLFDRLTKRGYTPEKVSENVQCEIMEVIAEEVRESYRAEITHTLTSNTVEDMEANTARIAAWLAENQGAAEEPAAAAGGAGGAASK